MRSIGRALILASSVLVAAHAAPAIRRWPVSLWFPRMTRVETDDAVALTFDDGPDQELEAFLELLGEAKARATFFVLGEQVARDPGRMKEIIHRGHDIGVHGHRHRNHLLRTPAAVVEDMRRARSIIEEAAERPTRFFRPPYGRFSSATWLEADRQGWERVLWSRNGHDYDLRATPSSVVANIGWPVAGDILLLHDSDRYGTPGSCRTTLQALPIILERLATLGLRTCSLDGLLTRATS
jgi:peptidoglycan-N-acetylglucosamine deacetylase